MSVDLLMNGSLTFTAGVLRFLPGSDLGPRTAGVQMHSVQATCPQEMSQGGKEAMLEYAAADAEHGLADDRQERRPTATGFRSM